MGGMAGIVSSCSECSDHIFLSWKIRTQNVTEGFLRFVHLMSGKSYKGMKAKANLVILLVMESLLKRI